MRNLPKLSAHALGTAALLAAALAATPAHARLDVEVWTDRGDDAVYRSGDAMRVKVRTSESAYLLVYEIDTEGRVNLLYPWKRGTGRVEGRRTLQLPPDEHDVQLVVEQETGQGFLVAVASEFPFRDLPWFLRPFDPQAASVGYEDAPGDGDREEGFDEQGRVVGDPYVAMERIRRRVMDDPGDTEAFASAYTTYYVHEQVRYPRYLCNDCHRPNQWAWWPGYDPYYANCSVFDFRVNWSWYWGPHIWTAYVPYYYYVVRTDCPPRYRPWVGNRNRFSAWDGWDRWSNLWGGQLRRFKPASAPVGYTPPPPRGMIWKGPGTPPGHVPKDVQRQTKSPGTRPTAWLTREAGNGQPVWKDAPRVQQEGRNRPERSGDAVTRKGGSDRPVWRPAQDGRPDRGQPTREREQWRPSGDSQRERGERVRPQSRPGEDSPRERGERGRQVRWPIENPPPPSQDEYERPRGRSDDARRPDPPRRDDAPRREEPARQEPVYKQPSAPPPQRSDPPRVSPPQSRPDPPRGGGKGKG